MYATTATASSQAAPITPKPATSLAVSFCPQPRAEGLRGPALLAGHPRRVEHQVGVVRDERALGRVDRDELHRAARPRLVELEQRRLLHRDRRRVAGPLRLQLLREEAARVRVMDDRVLDRPTFPRIAGRWTSATVSPSRFPAAA